MTYPELIDRLFHVNFFGGMKLGLTNCYHLQRLLQFPDHTFKSVHVAGTNGKGSVTTKIAQGLQAAGYRVGLYTSPHLSCFRERIRINGTMISEKNTIEILSSLFRLIDQENIPATFFELTTFLAFKHFANEQVDIAVLETGLGGRLDATNMIKPLLSVITSISLDHTEILGTTIEAITREKAGIIKPFTPVVVGPNVPISIIKEIAEQQQSPYFQLTGFFKTFEQENQEIARIALQQLSKQFCLSTEAIEKGLQGRQPCRFEVISSNPLVILDVAHNPDGLLHLFKAIQEYFPNRSLRILFGLSKSKDIQSCLTIMKDYGQDFHLVEASNGRGISVSYLQEKLNELEVDRTRIFIDSTICLSVRHALEKTVELNQVLIICGSFFIMSQVRQSFGLDEPIDEIDMNERSTTR